MIKEKIMRKFLSPKAFLKWQCKRQKILKVVIGAGGTRFEDWLDTDIAMLNITAEDDWKYLFPENSIDNLLAEHVLEHLDIAEIKMTLDNAYRYLKKGACLRMAVPDGYHVSEFYKEMTRPNGKENGAELHKVFLNIDLLREIVPEDKFNIEPVEYFDKEGRFHKHDYSLDRGFILRTAENYENAFFTKDAEEYEEFYSSVPKDKLAQLKDYKYTYTSLFCDLIKI